MINQVGSLLTNFDGAVLTNILCLRFKDLILKWGNFTLGFV